MIHTNVGLMFVAAGLITATVFDAPAVAVGLGVIGLVLCVVGVVDVYSNRSRGEDGDTD